MPSIISIEEGMDCRDSTNRFFFLKNQRTRLQITISKSSIISSCTMDSHEIILDNRQLRQRHDSWAIGERPTQKMSNQTWVCHVRETDLHLNSAHGSIVYQLNHYNELGMQARLRSPQLQQPVIYFNLKNAKRREPIDGHTLCVQSSDSSIRLESSTTQLLCQCNRSSSIIPQSLIGDVPFELVRNDNVQLAELSNPDEDDILITDAIFSLEARSKTDYIMAQLQYGSRGLQVELRPIVQGFPVANIPTTSTIPQPAESQQLAISTLKLRVRITNYGVCLMPVMMSNYYIVYKFLERAS